jgi:hypothetical protein
MVFICFFESLHLSKTEEFISKFHSLMLPSSWPVATRHDLNINVTQLSSEFFGASIREICSILPRSQRIMVLSSAAVMTFGVSISSLCVS